jgi:Na+-transporting methylmalonyl-CoA/oxaloacetate decarboxylase gamma subunit
MKRLFMIMLMVGMVAAIGCKKEEEKKKDEKKKDAKTSQVTEDAGYRLV